MSENTHTLQFVMLLLGIYPKEWGRKNLGTKDTHWGVVYKSSK